MPRFKKIVFTLLLLLVAGLVRMPLERPLGREMRAAGILAAPLDRQTSDAIGQTSAAIALGGLRSFVAAVLNFSKILPAWQDRDWLQIFDSFEEIHTLQPKAPYYWESAASYAAYDAYSDYKDRAGVPESQRRLRRDEFFHKGVSYLDEGIANVPDNISLRMMKSRLYSDVHKPDHLDYPVATEVLDEAVKLDKVTGFVRRQRLYFMSRVPERQQEALALAREIYADPAMRFPSIKSLLFTLQKQFPDEQAIPDLEIYRSEGEVVRFLFNHYQRRDEGLPMTGVRETLESYLAPMDLPYSLNPLRNTDLKRVPFKIADLLNEAPFQFPEDPYQQAGDWELVVNHFQAYEAESLPMVRVLFFVLQNITQVEAEERVPNERFFPNKLIAIRDLANFELDPGHNFPRNGVAEWLAELCQDPKLKLPAHLSPVEDPSLFPLNNEWMDEVRKWQFQQVNGL